MVASMEGRAEGSCMESVRLILYAGTLPSGNKAKTNVLVPVHVLSKQEGAEAGAKSGEQTMKGSVDSTAR